MRHAKRRARAVGFALLAATRTARRRCLVTMAAAVPLLPTRASAQTPGHEGRCVPVTPEVDAAVAALERCYLAGDLEGALTAGKTFLDGMAAAPETDLVARSRLLVEWGRISATRAFLMNTSTDEAEKALSEALVIAPAGSGVRADALIELGFAEYVRSFLGDGQYLGVLDRFEQAESIARSLADTARLSRAVFHEGLVRERTGHGEAALTSYWRALDLAQGCGCDLEASYGHRHVAFLLSAAGDHKGALRHFLESLALRRRVGFRLYLPFSLVTVANELLAMGRPGEAEAYAAEAQTLASELGIRRVEVQTLLMSAEVALALGRTTEAVDGFKAAAALSAEIGYGAGTRAASEGLMRAGGGRGTDPIEERIPAL